MNAYAIPGIDRRLTPDQIINVVCRIFNADRQKVLSKSRHRAHTIPRQTAMYIMLTHARYTTQSIACCFKKKQHGTVIHARKTIQNMIDTNDRTYSHKIQEAINAADPAGLPNVHNKPGRRLPMH